ncbi:MAG: diacylglycerol kinase [Desulfovibrionaceae bacterium]|nr:diacylglycerol kinase [Desulfovibrionaceae bacterium]
MDQSSYTTKKQQNNSINNIFKHVHGAFFYSLDGFKSVFQDEIAFRLILLEAIILIPIALMCTNSWISTILLILPNIICIIVELLNTSIENTLDRISLEIHPLVKKAKDMGSAAQMTSQLFLLLVWIVYLCKN